MNPGGPVLLALLVPAALAGSVTTQELVSPLVAAEATFKLDGGTLWVHPGWQG